MSQEAQILLAHCFVDSRTTADTFAIVVSRIGPPVGLHFDVAKNHVFNGRWQAGNLK